LDAQEDVHITVGMQFINKANKWGNKYRGSFAVNVLLQCGHTVALCIK